MARADHLWLYFLMVFRVIVLPGMDWPLSCQRLSGGRRAGAFAVAASCSAAATRRRAPWGFGLVFKLVPGLINARCWRLARSTLHGSVARCCSAQPAATVATRSLALPASPAAMAALPPWATFRRAALTCLMNPAYLFMFAIFPQFLRRVWAGVDAGAGAGSDHRDANHRCTAVGVRGGQRATLTARATGWHLADARGRRDVAGRRCDHGAGRRVAQRLSTSAPRRVGRVLRRYTLQKCRHGGGRRMAKQLSVVMLGCPVVPPARDAERPARDAYRLTALRCSGDGPLTCQWGRCAGHAASGRGGLADTYADFIGHDATICTLGVSQPSQMTKRSSCVLIATG